MDLQKEETHMAKNNYKKKSLGGWIALVVVAVVVIAFFVTSLCLASAHSQTVVQEWQQWFGITKQAGEVIEDVVEAVIRV